MKVSIYLSFFHCLSVHPSIDVSSIHPSNLYLPIHSYLSIFFICLSTCPSVLLSIHPSILSPTRPSLHVVLTALPLCLWTDSGCGGPRLLFGRKGVIHSLGFPSSYPAELQCNWTIRAPAGRLMELRFTDMAIPGEMGKCPEDALTISDSYRTLGE